MDLRDLFIPFRRRFHQLEKQMQPNFIPNKGEGLFLEITVLNAWISQFMLQIGACTFYFEGNIKPKEYFATFCFSPIQAPLPED